MLRVDSPVGALQGPGVPTWAAILIALTGGLIGVLARISHDRGAELRGRMLAAADEFLAASIPALIDLDEVVPPILSGGTIGSPVGAKPLDIALRDLHAAAKELELRLARVQLLFGSHSSAGESARTVASGIRDTANMLEFVRTMGMEEWPPKSVHAAFKERQRETHDAHARFGPEARRALLPWWSRWRPGKA